MIEHSDLFLEQNEFLIILAWNLNDVKLFVLEKLQCLLYICLILWILLFQQLYKVSNSPFYLVDIIQNILNQLQEFVKGYTLWILTWRALKMLVKSIFDLFKLNLHFFSFFQNTLDIFEHFFLTFQVEEELLKIRASCNLRKWRSSQRLE